MLSYVAKGNQYCRWNARCGSTDLTRGHSPGLTRGLKVFTGFLEVEEEADNIISEKDQPDVASSEDRRTGPLTQEWWAASRSWEGRKEILP